ncbi:MAG TPA: DUF6364 family protein [Syntrophales bacterium]|jgi:hypothetical protein|nr:DUF6364 family protein [Syntrophales bacterium]HPC33694.1 DUF6364 family protein [Syntrophales bacterium]HQG34141.1 DUF6364 family protein [Syntrophales bacterium]
MQTKLTLRLDEDLINQGKIYAQKKGKSLSRLVAEYLKLLAGKNSERRKFDAPVTESLRGLLRGSDVGSEDYRRYLEEKHK